MSNKLRAFKKPKAKKFAMNMISFNEAESAVANQRHREPKIFKNKGINFNPIKIEITGERGNRPLKSKLHPFKAFEPISGNDFSEWETDCLIDHIIKTHHDFAKKNAVIIYILAQKVFYRYGDTHPEMLPFNKVLFLFLHDLLNQMKEEEQFIFPHIRQTGNHLKYAGINDTAFPPSLKKKIKLLQIEHAKSFTYLKALREITDNFGIPSDTCNSYKTLFEKMKELEDDLNMHFHLENDILFARGGSSV